MPSSSTCAAGALLQFLAAVCQLWDVCVRQRQFRKLALLLGEVTDALPFRWLVDGYVAAPAGLS